MLVSRMRAVLSSDEIKDILSQKTDNEIWIDNKAERCEKIKEIISGGDCMKLVELIRRMHFHSKLQLKRVDDFTLLTSVFSKKLKNGL